MEVTTLKLRKCSVRLWRCDSIGRGSSTRAVPAAPHEPGAPAVPHAAHRLQDYKVFVVKIACDDEDSITTLGPSMDVQNSVNDMGILIKEESRFVMETEDEVMIKQELDIAPTILQPRPAHHPHPPLNQASASAPRSGISSEDGAASAFIDTIYQTASRTVVEAAYCGKEYEVPSTANCELNMKTTDCYQGVLGECSNYEDTSAGRKEEGRCIYWPFQNGHLIRKILTHTRKKGYKCDQCQYSTSKTDNFKNHMRTHTGEKPYKCEHCEYSASRITHLKNHMRIHTGDKPYKCKQCEYSASQLNNLKNHMRTHTCEKPYKCKQCEYSGSRITHLKNHMRIHTGDKPYKCEQCEYSACRLDNLKNHMHTHTHEKPYKCEQCKYSASRLHHLKNHMRTHTGEKPYKCEYCEYSASRLDNLKNHMRTHTVE